MTSQTRSESREEAREPWNRSDLGPVVSPLGQVVLYEERDTEKLGGEGRRLLQKLLCSLQRSWFELPWPNGRWPNNEGYNPSSCSPRAATSPPSLHEHYELTLSILASEKPSSAKIVTSTTGPKTDQPWSPYRRTGATPVYTSTTPPLDATTVFLAIHQTLTRLISVGNKPRSRQKSLSLLRQQGSNLHSVRNCGAGPAAGSPQAHQAGGGRSLNTARLPISP